MSNIRVSDKKGGVYEAAIDFSYGECERLPFNILRRIRARLRAVPSGGLVATATFNIRNPDESNAFLEMLDLFGEDGSYKHGSSADAGSLTLLAPPQGAGGGFEDDDLEIEGTLNEL
jgi:hypothetical protein